MERTEIVILDDGTKLVLEKLDSVRSCSIYITVASGTRYETPENAGISHFIEHMLFKGTVSRSALQISEEMDEIGGELNAYTAKEFTCFYSKSLTCHSVKALDILCDMITHPRLDENDIELEKGVVCEEIAMYEDIPEEVCCSSFYASVMKDSMLGSEVLGTRETVNSLSREMLEKHIKRFFTPQRMVISICGNFDRNAVISKCREYFIPREYEENPLSFEPVQYTKSFTSIKKDSEQNTVYFGFPGIQRRGKYLQAANLLGSILGSSSSSRLFQRLREELGLVYSVDCSNIPFMNTGLFVFSMGVSPASEKKALTESVRIISEIGSTITEKELIRAKEGSAAGFIMGFESTVSRASFNSKELLLFGKIRSFDEIENEIRSVTIEDIRTVAEMLFDFSKVSLCTTGKVHSEDYYKKLMKGTANE